MPAGSAWGKWYRTCKSCVGTDFCRYGLGDSMGLSYKIEKRFRGIDSPAKLKLAAAGCPRNCSEALIKDVGFVAVGDGKWEIYIGGAGGSHVRKGDLLCTVDSEESAIAYGGRFMQFYRENAKWRAPTISSPGWASNEFARSLWRTAKDSAPLSTRRCRLRSTPPMIPGRRRPLPRP
jgi:nitrite reductase (NADH) large subunit